MKHFSKFFPVLALLAFFGLSSFTGESNHISHFSFSGDTSDTRKVTISDQYSMMIGKHMKEDKTLNDEASLQYADTEEELYIIVIDEVTKDFTNTFRSVKGWDNNMTAAENYRRVQMASLKKKIKFKGKPVITKTKAGTLAMEIVDVTAKVSGIDSPIFYKVGFLEGGDHLYMVMSWTLADMKTRHSREMEEMISSIRMVN
jgi:hypothetical protein